jgi:hypothetical protein
MARRPDLVEITPDIEAEHVARVVTGAASRGGHCSIEAKIGQVEAGDERIDDADERVSRDVVFNTGWK